MSETTFKQTYEFLETHGWVRIYADEYERVKSQKKHQTARIGSAGFFKLSKSNQEIEIQRNKQNQVIEGLNKTKVKYPKFRKIRVGKK